MNIDILLAKYFGGEASGKEMQMLDEWISESVENQKYFDDMTIIYQKTRLPINHQEYKPDVDKALASYKQYISRSNKNNKYLIYIISAAAAILILFLPNFFNTKKISTKDISESITLPDGNSVKLAERSILRFKSYKDNKTINLIGKADFEITHHDGKQLLVELQDQVYVKDIGTEFSIDAYPENDLITVSVKSGIVEFYSSKDKGIILKENESGIYNKQIRKFEKIITNTKPTILHFDSKSLKSVIDEISIVYGVNIIIEDEDLNNIPISVQFIDESVETVIAIICQTLSITSKVDNKTYILSK